MAKSEGMGGILKLALLAGGGYYLYTRMTAAPAAAAGSAGSTGSTPAAGSTTGLSLSDIVAAVKNALTPAAAAGGTPTAPASADGLIAELKLAAKGNNLFSADGKGIPDYWMYYRNQLHPPGVNLPAQFAGAGGQITAEEFVAGLKQAGLAGYGLGAVPIVLPMVLNLGGQRVLVVPRGAFRGGW